MLRVAARDSGVTRNENAGAGHAAKAEIENDLNFEYHF